LALNEKPKGTQPVIAKNIDGINLGFEGKAFIAGAMNVFSTPTFIMENLPAYRLPVMAHKDG
jgi:hypothetical protein